MLHIFNFFSFQVTSHGEDIIYLTNKFQDLEGELMCLKKIVNKQVKGQEEKDMKHNVSKSFYFNL